MVFRTRENQRSSIEVLNYEHMFSPDLKKNRDRLNCWGRSDGDRKFIKIMCNWFLTVSLWASSYLPAQAYDGITCSNGVYENFDRWGPQNGNQSQWLLAKWKQPIAYAIKDLTGGSARAATLKSQIESEIPEFAQATGVKMESNPSEANTGIFISNDINATDLQTSDLLRTVLVAAMGSGANINALMAIHRQLLVQAAPRCTGLVASNTKEGIVGSFIYLQADQDEPCALIALSHLFGIGNTWIHDSNQVVTNSDIVKIKSEALGAAHEIYDPSLQQGMTNAQVIAVMAEHCK